MSGNIFATENQQPIIDDVIEVKIGVYLHKNCTNAVKRDKDHAGEEWFPTLIVRGHLKEYVS